MIVVFEAILLDSLRNKHNSISKDLQKAVSTFIRIYYFFSSVEGRFVLPDKSFHTQIHFGQSFFFFTTHFEFQSNNVSGTQ